MATLMQRLRLPGEFSRRKKWSHINALSRQLQPPRWLVGSSCSSWPLNYHGSRESSSFLFQRHHYNNQQHQVCNGTSRSIIRSFSTSGRRKKPDEKISAAKSSDPPVWTWLEQVLPQSWQPYARLARMDKPIGTMLLVRSM